MIIFDLFAILISFLGRGVSMAKCVLYDRECIGCMECEICDLDPNKICDNCGKCLDIQDFATIKIDGIYDEKGNNLNLKKKKFR